MAKAKSTTVASRRTQRIARLKSKLRKTATAKKASVSAHKTKAYTSLSHLLNATALYQMGEYERASLAFQRAMSEEDAPEMLESLEDAQAQLEGGDLVSEEPTDEQFPDMTEEVMTVDGEDLGEDYLTDDVQVEEEIDYEDDSEDLDLEIDEEAGSDISAGDLDDDFSVDPSELEDTAVISNRASRAAQNLAALFVAQSKGK